MSPPFVPVAALAVLTGLTSCSRQVEPAPAIAAPVNVRVAPLETSTVSPAIRVAGVLARQTEVELSLPVGGVIERLAVRAGDRVAKDQELARLQTDQLDAQVVQARALLDKAQRDLGRIEKLQGERVATLENLEDARTQVEQATAALRIAAFNRRHSVLAAPNDGVVLRRFAEPNELVSAGRAVLAFATDNDGWIVTCGLTPRDVARVALGARVQLRDSTGGTAVGKIVRMAGAIDSATGTVSVEAMLDSPPAGARSGLVVAVSIAPEPVPARAVVPLAALRDGTGGRAAIFLVEAGASKVKRVWVDVEQVDGERVYLRTMLAPPSRVIVTGQQFVRDGEAVNVVEDVRAAATR